VKLRTLGRTGLRVSEIGFGAWAIGGEQAGARRSYGPTDDRESLAALEAAFELGGNFIDTADAYGVGHSEELIGRFLRGKRDRVIVATKFGHFPFPDPDDRTLAEGNVRHCLEASLRRLGTDTIDLYQCHECTLAVARAHDLAATMEKLKAEGKIRHAGLSVYGCTQIRQAARGEFGAVFATVQESYNVTTLLFREALHEAAAAGLGIIIREPLGNGLLTGRYSGSETWDGKHARGVRAADQAAMRIEFARRLRDFLPVAGRTLVQSLIRFALQDVPASVVIPGCKTPDQVRENLGAADAPALSAGDLQRIHALHAELRAQFGRIHPYAMDSTLGLE
jgi:aryl-alcohol dehydrogenase-like predicted oxidoreductase